MESQERQVVKERIPWLAILGIVYGLLVFLLMPIYAIASRIVGVDERIVSHLLIAVIIAILVSHFSLYGILRKPHKYKWKVIVWIGVFIAYAVLTKGVMGAVFKPRIYKQQLESQLVDITHINVKIVGYFLPEGATLPSVDDYSDADISKIDTLPDIDRSSEDVEWVENKFAFKEADKGQIQQIVDSIKISPFGTPGYCACSGNQIIEFYQDEKMIIRISFHHGESLRWTEGWESDMTLTSASAEHLKQWLSSHGCTNFE